MDAKLDTITSQYSIYSPNSPAYQVAASAAAYAPNSPVYDDVNKKER